MDDLAAHVHPGEDEEVPLPDLSKEGISASVPDWERERPRRLWDPSRRLLGSLRRYQRWSGRAGPLGRAVQIVSSVEHKFWSVVTGADIPLNAQIEGGLVLLHPNGVVVHPNARVGPNCLLLQQVTLVEGVELEGHVDVYAGAKIVGTGVRIGRHARIGANAVVTQDVPAGALAAGVPAKIVRRAKWHRSNGGP